MTRLLALLALSLVVTQPAAAQDFTAVTERDRFVQLLEGRELYLRMFNVRLEVSPDGKIAGSALGWGITGTWDWQDGFFCREMDWSGQAIPMNCQLVEARGDAEMRFTVDRGRGEAASFRLE